MPEIAQDIAFSQDLYNNENNRFWGYFGRAPLAPVDDVAGRMGAFAVYNYIQRNKERSPILRKGTAGLRWINQNARKVSSKISSKISSSPFTRKIADATSHVWYRYPSMTEAHEAWRTMYGSNAPRTLQEARVALRTPRLRVTPGDPAALAKVKRAISSTGNVLRPARDFTKTVFKKGASSIGAFNEAVGTGVQALPRVSGGRMHRLAKQAFSKKGAALGFAIQGVSDAALAAGDLMSIAANRDKLDSAYFDWTWKDTRKVFSRTLWGFLRGVDSALLGIPGMIPGVNIDSDSYHDVDFDVGGGQEQLMEAVDAATSAQDAAKIVSMHDVKVMKNLRQGKDADGKRIKTLDRNGNVVDLSADEGNRQADLIMASRAMADNERKLMLYGKSLDDLDRKSLRDALRKIDDAYNVKAERFNAAYDNYGEWSKGQKSIRPGVTADQWATSVESNINNEWERRRRNLVKTQLYRDMIEENRRDARELYMGRYRGSLSEAEADQRFNYFWESSGDTFREQYRRTMFEADLIQAYKESQMTQPSGVIAQPTVEEQNISED